MTAMRCGAACLLPASPQMVTNKAPASNQTAARPSPRDQRTRFRTSELGCLPSLGVVLLRFRPALPFRLASWELLEPFAASGRFPLLPLLPDGVHHSLQAGSSSESSEIKIRGVWGPLLCCPCPSGSSTILIGAGRCWPASASCSSGASEATAKPGVRSSGMRSSGTDGVLHFPSPPLLPLSRMLPGSSKIVRSLALSKARYPRSSVMLPSIMVALGPSEGPATLELLFGNALSQRLTSQRSCAMPSRSLGLP
jgi:hypothetical protein